MLRGLRGENIDEMMTMMVTTKSNEVEEATDWVRA